MFLKHFCNNSFLIYFETFLMFFYFLKNILSVKIQSFDGSYLSITGDKATFSSDFAKSTDFTFKKISDYFLIVNNANKKVFDVVRSKNKIIEYTEHGGTNQRFKKEEIMDGSKRMKYTYFGGSKKMCMAALNGTLVLEDCLNKKEQVFTEVTEDTTAKEMLIKEKHEKEDNLTRENLNNCTKEKEELQKQMKDSKNKKTKKLEDLKTPNMKEIYEYLEKLVKEKFGTSLQQIIKAGVHLPENKK